MRISDWSSDVCSSDLVSPVALASSRRASSAALVSVDSITNVGSVSSSNEEKKMAARSPSQGSMSSANERSEERRVGKSVSVRVDLGGRRILKKKKNIHT